MQDRHGPAAGFPVARSVSRLAFAVALTWSVVGTATAQKVAPAGSRAFVLYEFEVHDPAGFKTLTGKLRDSLRTSKGEFVMREKVSSIFGGEPSNLSVISFPSVADAKTWLASADVGQLKAERDKVASTNTYLVEQLE